jgi:hypothetical protein
LPGNQWIKVNYADINGCDAIQPTNLDVAVVPGDSVNVSVTAFAINLCTGAPVTLIATPTCGGTLTYFRYLCSVFIHYNLRIQ